MNRPKTAPGLAPAQMSEPIWFPKREAALQARIKELEKECAQWQESSGQNYVRATEAEMREEKLQAENERLRCLLKKETDG